MKTNVFKTQEEIDMAIDEACLEMYGKKHKDLPKPAPLWSDEKFRAYQKMTRKFK